MPGVNVTIRQDDLSIRIHLQQLVDEHNAWYILDHLLAIHRRLDSHYIIWADYPVGADLQCNPGGSFRNLLPSKAYPRLETLL
jgi:hypothetical protein